mgnify:CR=1 FL=1
MSRVKIVATIGPQTSSERLLRALHAAGMDVARLNGSHADPDWHTRAIRLIRATLPDVPILFDLPGRKIRTRRLRHEPTFNAGDTIVLTTDESHDGQVKVPVTCAQVPSALSGGGSGTKQPAYSMTRFARRSARRRLRRARSTS